MKRPWFFRCARCGHAHEHPHSDHCSVCCGDLWGDVPGSPADESVEVCDDGGEHA